MKRLKFAIKTLKPLAPQRGLATILIVLLVGVSMTAIVMGIAGSVKSTQQKQTAVHAATHAQSAAWAAVQVFKLYLKGVEYDEVDNLIVGQNIPLLVDTMPQTLNASIVSIDSSAKASDGIYVTVNLKANDLSAQSTAAIQVVYRIKNTVCSVCQLLSAQLDLFDDTNLSGDISFSLPAGATSTVNVDGEVNAMHISLNNVTYLNATGDVVLGSAVPIEEVYTNGDLLLDGSATVNKASVLGAVTLKNNGKADIIYTNGDVEMDGGATLAVNSLGDVDLTKYVAQETIIAAGDVTISAPVRKVHAQGNIHLTQWADARDIATEGTLTCPSPHWNMFDLLQAEIALSGCPVPSATVKSGIDLTVPLMEPLLPFSAVKPTIDAWALKGQANYVFEFQGGDIRVTVNNVNGVGDGVYFLGRYPYANGRDHMQYLCDALDAAGNCTSPATMTKTICQGHSTANACFSYSNGTKTWMVDGRNMAPGVVWFDGNLMLANGEYYNTFIATGDIGTAGALKSYAPNYIGFDSICNNAFPLNPVNDFAQMYPEQLCDLTDNELLYDSLGNVALLAGGNNPNQGGSYEGGDINLGASNEMFGTLLAGNYFDTAGDTIVHGYISAVATDADASSHDLGGKTTIVLDNLPPTYRPNEVPMGDGSMCMVDCDSSPDGAEVLWSRYL